MQQVVVLGSTGSIGKSTLDVIGRHPERYRVFALTCQRNVDALLAQIREFSPRYVVVMDAVAHQQVCDALVGTAAAAVTVLSGEQGLCEVASHPDVDVVMAAIVGAAGLSPTLAAVHQGKRVLLANKEALVMAGSLFMQAVQDSGATLMPIDSEHNAIFQCMPSAYQQGLERCGVDRILLTASGGPFRNSSAQALAQVTPAQACAHPNWSMGQKISVDSATLMNKGLELIEACQLFGTEADRVDIVVHPQSIIHSMVQYIDGSVLAQLGNPDMRTPIAHGLAWPERIAAGVAPLDVLMTARLDFEAPDPDRFPCLRLAREACDIGGTASAVLNAANEVAVESFLAGQLSFTGIAELVEGVMAQSDFFEPADIAAVKAADSEARRVAHQQLAALIA
jgi:1-deoxy-D-xylulose-5-phosphate reductoisomerase